MSNNSTLSSEIPHSAELPANKAKLSRILGTQTRRALKPGDIETLSAELNGGWLFYVFIENARMFKGIYGSELAGAAMDIVEKALQAATSLELPCANPLMLRRLEYGKFMVICKSEGLSECELPDLAYRLRIKLRGIAKRDLQGLAGHDLELSVGYSVLSEKHPEGFERSLFGALLDAQRTAKHPMPVEKLGLLREFRSLLEGPSLGVAYQPIVDFNSGQIFAWEALARPPKHGSFPSPLDLFDFAEDAGAVFALEKACRETAIRNFGPPRGGKLFLNVHPRTMVDPGFQPGETRSLLAKLGLSPHDVVLEITERHPTRDFALFHRTLDHYRSEGFSVAVDDVGTGYSGLWSIAEIRPEFIKIDASLIRGVDGNPVKRALVETFLTFADKVGCKIIAEGIETETELSCLASLGLHYGQGFYLCRPAYPKPSIPAATAARIGTAARRINLDTRCSMPVSSLVEEARQVAPDSPVELVKELLEPDGASKCVAVVQNDRPLGLIMSHQLNSLLSSRYGVSLYLKREAAKIMDAAPLVVDGQSLIENVAKAAMSRESYKIYDHILVTEQGMFLGTVSVQRMLDALAAAQVEMAKGANPLTGLPGNLAIEREVEARSQGKKPVSFIYADLDNFKIYNDTYGFKEGDNVLLLAAKIMSWALRRHGNKSDFLGHVGGDDYFLATSPKRAERICRAVTRCFKRLAPLHYTEADRARGGIEGRDRNGQAGHFPFVSISLAIVDCQGACSMQEISRRAAELKKFAKTLPGNVFVRDRRRSAFEEANSTPCRDGK